MEGRGEKEESERERERAVLILLRQIESWTLHPCHPLCLSILLPLSLPRSGEKEGVGLEEKEEDETEAKGGRYLTR